MLKNGTSVYVRFEYEKLTLFYFLCGKLGHGESFCPIRAQHPRQEFEFNWDIFSMCPIKEKPNIDEQMVGGGE